MSDIFISYASQDKMRVQVIAQMLQGQGWSVFWDRTIPIGRTWRDTIGKELDEARCVLVLWSKFSIESNWVHEEAEDAKKRGILVPVLIEGVQPPIGFRSIQAADLTNWDPTDSTEPFHWLVQGIAAIIGQPAKEAEEEHKRAAQEVQPRAEEDRKQAQWRAEEAKAREIAKGHEAKDLRVRVEEATAGSFSENLAEELRRRLHEFDFFPVVFFFLFGCALLFGLWFILVSIIMIFNEKEPVAGFVLLVFGVALLCVSRSFWSGWRGRWQRTKNPSV